MAPRFGTTLLNLGNLNLQPLPTRSPHAPSPEDDELQVTQKPWYHYMPLCSMSLLSVSNLTTSSALRQLLMHCFARSGRGAPLIATSFAPLRFHPLSSFCAELACPIRNPSLRDIHAYFPRFLFTYRVYRTRSWSRTRPKDRHGTRTSTQYQHQPHNS